MIVIFLLSRYRVYHYNCNILYLGEHDYSWCWYQESSGRAGQTRGQDTLIINIYLVLMQNKFWWQIHNCHSWKNFFVFNLWVTCWSVENQTSLGDQILVLAGSCYCVDWWPLYVTGHWSRQWTLGTCPLWLGKPVSKHTLTFDIKTFKSYFSLQFATCTSA